MILLKIPKDIIFRAAREAGSDVILLMIPKDLH